MRSPTALSASIESALNLYLRQDPRALQRCAELDGKVIALHLEGADLDLYFLPGAGGMHVTGSYEGTADTRLRGGPLGLLRLLDSSRENALFEGAAVIEGDTDTGRALQELLSSVDIDWEEKLSHVTGDVLAHQAGKAFAQTRRYLSNSLRTLEEDLSEYLQEEARTLPARIEVEQFLDQVDALRSQTDLLEARVKRLLLAAGRSS